MSTHKMIEEARRLRERAAWLISPDRRTGPSRHEAADEASDCVAKAEKLECDAFYSTPVNK